MTARNLRAIRAHRGWTQGHLAVLAGVPQSSLCHIERGAQPKRPEILTRIAAALDLPEAALHSEIVLRASGAIELVAE